jgi:hypothetical protein
MKFSTSNKTNLTAKAQRRQEQHKKVMLKNPLNPDLFLFLGDLAPAIRCGAKGLAVKNYFRL